MASSHIDPGDGHASYRPLSPDGVWTVTSHDLDIEPAQFDMSGDQLAFPMNDVWPAGQLDSDSLFPAFPR